MRGFHQKLTDKVKSHGRLCVGLDPRLEQLPLAFQELKPGTAYERFCGEVLKIVRPFSGIVKPQSAFFEALGPDGLMVMQAVIDRAVELGYFVILDSKRGDIASTATAYATAGFATGANALTVNPYLGADAVEPFITEARKDSRGLFVLVRTSNPGSGRFQNLICDGRPIYRHVGEAVNQWNTLGDVGAVVGATHPRELQELRAAMPGVWFLIPGYGVQGGSAADVDVPLSIVNSSRGITFPFQPHDPDWATKIELSAGQAQAELRQ